MIYDIVIIGAGAAGLGAAVYASMAGMSCAVIEKNPVSGGQINDTDEVDNYLGFPGVSGAFLAESFKKHADKYNIDFICEEVKEIKAGTNEAPRYCAY